MSDDRAGARRVDRRAAAPAPRSARLAGCCVVALAAVATVLQRRRPADRARARSSRRLRPRSTCQWRSAPCPSPPRACRRSAARVTRASGGRHRPAVVHGRRAARFRARTSRRTGGSPCRIALVTSSDAITCAAKSASPRSANSASSTARTRWGAWTSGDNSMSSSRANATPELFRPGRARRNGSRFSRLGPAATRGVRIRRRDLRARIRRPPWPPRGAGAARCARGGAGGRTPRRS